MSTKLRYWWQEMWSSYWFVPTMIVLSAVALAVLLVILEPLGDVYLFERWPLFFGAIWVAAAPEPEHPTELTDRSLAAVSFAKGQPG